MRHCLSHCTVARITCQFAYDDDLNSKFIISFKNYRDMERWFDHPTNHVYRILQIRTTYKYDDET